MRDRNHDDEWPDAMREESDALVDDDAVLRRRDDGNWEILEPDPVREDSGDPNTDRAYLQDLPPADADRKDSEREDSEDAEVESTPAGRAGADTGSSDAVKIDPETTTQPGGVSPDRGEQNDAAGVGPRDPDDDS